MTGTAITLIDFAAAVHATVPPDIHPAARATIHTWLSNLMSAASDGDATTVAKLARRITDKVAQERGWEREDLRNVGRPYLGNQSKPTKPAEPNTASTIVAS